MLGRETEKLKSFLGAESEFQGELTSKGVLRVDGAVRGRLQADQVILSETTTMEGEVVAKRIIVAGKVEGYLRATELVEITSKGKVRGEIYTKRFLVMEGGEFNGQIEMNGDEPNVLDFEARNEEIFSVKS